MVKFKITLLKSHPLLLNKNYKTVKRMNCIKQFFCEVILNESETSIGIINIFIKVLCWVWPIKTGGSLSNKTFKKIYGGT